MIDALIKKDLTLHRVISGIECIVKRKDPELYKHGLGVSQLSGLLAVALGLPEDKVREVSFVARLHDIGKLAIPDNILYKNDSLTPEEWAIMNRHPIYGAEFLYTCLGKPMDAFDKFLGDISILAHMGIGRLREFLGPENDFLFNLLSGILFHHERYDGKGYPCGISGNDLSIIPAIIAVADNYVAMREHRPYRKGFERDYILKIILRDRGTLLHPAVVDKLLSYLTAPPRIRVELSGTFKVLNPDNSLVIKGVIKNISKSGLCLVPFEHEDYKKGKLEDPVYVYFELEHEKIGLLGKIARVQKDRGFGICFMNNKEKSNKKLDAFLQHKIKEKMNCTSLNNCEVSFSGTLPPSNIKDLSHYEQELLEMRFCYSCAVNQGSNQNLTFLNKYIPENKIDQNSCAGGASVAACPKVGICKNS